MKAEKGLTPMSARVNDKANPDAGFTLLEALVTLMIVGLLAGAVALSTPAPHAEAKAEAERLAARLMLARDDSILRNRVVGLMMTEQGYGFSRLEAEGWRTVQETAPLRFRTLPQDVQARVVEERGQDTSLIAVRFDPMGQASPIEIAVEGGGGAYRVGVSATGAVGVERVR